MSSDFSERSPYYPNADDIPTNDAEVDAHEDWQEDIEREQDDKED